MPGILDQVQAFDAVPGLSRCRGSRPGAGPQLVDLGAVPDLDAVRASAGAGDLDQMQAFDAVQLLDAVPGLSRCRGSRRGVGLGFDGLRWVSTGALGKALNLGGDGFVFADVLVLMNVRVRFVYKIGGFDMGRAELKEMDREILQFWERRVLLEKIELQHPKARSRIQGYKDRGVVGADRVINWAKFEAVDPPKMRGGIAGDNTKEIPGIVLDNTKAIPRGNTRTIPGIALSPEDAEALRELVRWWRTRKEGGGVPSGKRKAVTFKLLEGLLEELKSASKREGKSQAEILSLALLDYLRIGTS